MRAPLALAPGRTTLCGVSLWSRLWRRFAVPEAPAGARALEDRGDFAAAALEYEREGLVDEALRMLVILADADPDPASRVRTLARTLRLAAQQGDPPRELRARYARARLDVLRPAPGGAAPVWELTSLGRELEDLEEFEAAAEAFGLAGDRNAQVRLLAASGKIEELEGILASENERTRSGHLRTQLFADASTLSTGGQRLEALRRARVFADLNPGDDEVRALIHSLSERLVKPPSIRLDVDGEAARYVLLAQVIVGRTGAAIEVSSPMLSRRHLSVEMRDGAPAVEDLATRNGTLLAGSRLAGSLPVRGPLSLRLGGEVPCELAPRAAGGVTAEVAGERYVLPLAPRVAVGPWVIEALPGGEGVRLSVPPGAPPPILNGGVSAGEGLDLCFGDVIHRDRQGTVALRVLS